MSRLLKMEFRRLFRSNVFYICAAVPALLELVAFINYIVREKPQRGAAMDGILMNGIEYVLPLCTAVFVGVFVSAEHGGALHNKIIAGHKRVSVYLSELVMSLVGALAFSLSNIIFSVVPILVCGGTFSCSFDVIMLHQLMYYVVNAGLCALFTMISLLVPKKAAGTVAALVFVVSCMLVEYLFFSFPRELLEQEAYYRDFADLDGDGKPEEFYRDPTNAEKTELAFLTAAEMILPFGQYKIIYEQYVIEAYGDTYLKKKPLGAVAGASFGIMCVTTLAGVLVFRKKDLK